MRVVMPNISPRMTVAPTTTMAVMRPPSPVATIIHTGSSASRSPDSSQKAIRMTKETTVTTLPAIKYLFILSARWTAKMPTSPPRRNTVVIWKASRGCLTSDSRASGR
jgi:hypothetical protein